MLRKLLVVSLPIHFWDVIEGAANSFAIKNALLVQAIESSHHRGVCQSGRELLVKIANAGFAPLPNPLHQFGFELTELLYRSLPCTSFSLQPHRLPLLASSHFTSEVQPGLKLQRPRR